MTWLVTGGAGYIGAHIVAALQAAGSDPVVLDDLSTGRREFVPPKVDFVHGNILNTSLVEEALRGCRASGVIHVAGYKYAGESVTRPLHTYSQNVDGTRSVLEAMRRTGVSRIVFSSSAAVYGTPDVPKVTEFTPKKPTNPYGESKLVGEWLLRDVAQATRSEAHPLRHTSLRYFNVVGSGDLGVYDSSPFNLFPIAYRALAAGETPVIYGTDYSTPDGTAVRDYVHVSDIAAAHAVAAQRLENDEALQPSYNLGSGAGLSVREIMTAMQEVTGIAFTAEAGARRAGDPDRIVASGAAAARDLDWAMSHSVHQMVRSGWEAHPRQTAEAAQ